MMQGGAGSSRMDISRYTKHAQNTFNSNIACVKTVFSLQYA